LHVGSDTDGASVPDDIGWGKVAAAKSADFVGKRSLALPENIRPDRLQLVGLKGSGREPLIVGSHVRFADSQLPSDGWITSAGQLTSDDSHIALALVRAGRSRLNEGVTVHDEGQQKGAAVIVNPPFYDLPGARLNA
jgi:sarcosine oxidase subunit alpha